MLEDKKRVVIFGFNPKLGVDLFEYLAQLFDVQMYGREDSLNAESLLEKVADADVVCMVGGHLPIDAGVLKRMPRTRLLVVSSTGYDYVDVDAAAACGIAVCNSPAFSSYSVAEFQFALLFTIARKLDRVVRRRQERSEFSFSFDEVMGLELHGKTIGIIGTGSNGAHACRIARGLGMEVLAYSRSVKERLASELGVRYVPLDRLLAESDFISINVPLTAETRSMIGAAEIARMKRGAILINTARGEIVDENALASALTAGTIAYSGLDVVADNSDRNPLFALDNVLITPHMAWVTTDALRRMVNLMVENILGFFIGEAQNVVNKVYYNPVLGKSERRGEVLGDRVSVVVCQSLLETLGRGEDSAAAAGRDLIRKTAANLSRGSVEEAVFQLRHFLKDSGIGILHPTKLSDSECRFYVEEALERPRIGSVGESFTSGLMKEFFRQVTGRETAVTESEATAPFGSPLYVVRIGTGVDVGRERRAPDRHCP